MTMTLKQLFYLLIVSDRPIECHVLYIYAIKVNNYLIGWLCQIYLS